MTNLCRLIVCFDVGCLYFEYEMFSPRVRLKRGTLRPHCIIKEDNRRNTVDGSSGNIVQLFAEPSQCRQSFEGMSSSQHGLQ